jgi:threonine dehydrogenase-like Zn-dependent dehydrogenase
MQDFNPLDNHNRQVYNKSDMETMNAIWLENQKLSYRMDMPVPSPRPGEALVRVRLAGICSTDLELRKGYYPFRGIPGHEFVGEVVCAPQESEYLIGKRVVGEINAGCGNCELCKAGHKAHCEERTVLGILNRNGAFARYLQLPVQNLYSLPDSLCDEAAVFTEPLAAALEIQEQIKINPSDRAMVIGAGRLGQLIAQTLSLAGCDVLVIFRHPRQEKLLKDRGISAIHEKFAVEPQMDLVVEATGCPEGFHLARRAVKPGGTIVLKSTYRGEQKADFSALVVDEITIVGSRCGPFIPALRLLEKKKVDPIPLIEKRYPLSDGPAAFDHAAQPGVFKVLLDTL